MQQVSQAVTPEPPTAPFSMQLLIQIFPFNLELPTNWTVVFTMHNKAVQPRACEIHVRASNTLSGVAGGKSCSSAFRETFQWLVVESTSGLDRACVLLPLLQPELLLPERNSCGLET